MTDTGTIESPRMPFDYEDLAPFAPRPFRRVSTELLTEVLRGEIKEIIQLFAEYPDLRKLFDVPQTTIPQRITCFQLLAHHKIIEIIDTTLVDRYEDSLAFNEEAANAVRMSENLVTSDAPTWVREMDEVVEWLPVRIYQALPDAAKDDTVRSGANALDTIEQLEGVIARVFGEQIKRLKERWSANVGQPDEPKMPKHWRKGFHGLGAKANDLSKYQPLLTDKQWMALSLKLEHELGPVEIASRMGIDRKTVSEHLAAADKRIREAYSSERRKATRAANEPD